MNSLLLPRHQKPKAAESILGYLFREHPTTRFSEGPAPQCASIKFRNEVITQEQLQ